MTGLQVFGNGEFELRITPSGDSFTVEAPGLARALGFRDANTLVQSIPNEEKGYGLARTPGGDQCVWTLTEPGFYRAIGQRQAARVKDERIREQVTRFQNWVYREVLPAIRRTGSYSVADAYQIPRTLPEALRAYAAEVEAHEATQAALAEAAPKADAWDALAEAHGDYSLREAAQILNRDPLISTGQNRLARYLRDIGWADRTGQPYQAQVDAGRLVRRTTSYEHPRTGEREATCQTRITVKGLKELRQRLAGQRQLTVIDGGAA
ncbi:phage antirepressor KilAC domain-containing protein [Thermomonospora cellulosilytica]|uniref:Phage antirepressor YoqD-like protein n=1 Tax=Thermomonospora cellulosilytica TaxID=1411118 RepID=A0A7W3R8G9_9ACTN|nr:phage antirepressor KilAC domain-containing protein [Thermomonospora cellulosilytica]MBA9003706.1 phage antirepressor YoqD-like protein [Thermomonospora cellulosilytica]